MRCRLLLALILITGGLIACGDDDGSVATEAPGSTVAPSSTVTTATTTAPSTIARVELVAEGEDGTW